MTSPRVALVALALVISAGGCDSSLSPDAELARARARWAANGSDDYTVESRIMCFCPAYLVQWTTLTIEDGVVVKAEPLEEPLEGFEPSLAGWQTVEELFDVLGQPVEPLIVNVDATFDASLGYPRRVDTTCDDIVADCGSVREMRNLRITR